MVNERERVYEQGVACEAQCELDDYEQSEYENETVIRPQTNDAFHGRQRSYS